MNKVILMGRLTRNPDVRYSNSDTPMAITRYALAIKRKKGKESESEADFVDVVAFGKGGEFAAKYFQKGQMITIVGRIHQDVWEDQEKNKHYRFEVIADEQYFAGNKTSQNTNENGEGAHEAAATITENELPFQYELSLKKLCFFYKHKKKHSFFGKVL